MYIFADAGLPMIALTWPWSFALLLPIIVIEVLAAQLPKDVPLRYKVSALSVANVVSTLAGWPIAWAAMVAVEFAATNGGEAFGMNSPLKVILAVTLQSAWLIPYEDQFYWMIPAAVIFLLLPFLLISVWSEGLIVRLMLPQVPARQRRRSVWRANLFSYCFLWLCSFIWLICSLQLHKPEVAR
jgi:hypothetical protein